MKKADKASQYRVCPVCGSDNRKLFYMDRTHGESFDIVRCIDCNCIYTLSHPFVPLESDERAYTYDLSDTGMQTFATTIPQKELEKRLVFIGASRQSSNGKPGHGKLLDVGSGGGDFMLMASKHGWEVYGIEPSEVAVERSRKMGLQNLFNSTIDEAELNEDYFDAITMWDVIEHLENPGENLSKCYQVLKKDGVICISTNNPIFYELKIKLFGRLFPKLNPPKHLGCHPFQHLQYLSPDCLGSLLEKYGFTVTEIAISNYYFTSGGRMHHFLQASYDIFAKLTYLFLPRDLLTSPNYVLFARK